MDVSKVIPGGFDGVKHYGIHSEFKWHDRSSARPVKFYFIDFGLSKEYSVKEPYETTIERNEHDETVPELQIHCPYDPWKVDVYQLGKVILEIAEANFEGKPSVSGGLESQSSLQM
ncbi:hypothetical protein H0H92_011088 [Tricholoma furcatifolium]|nr:hypothetical protein H0H92_011088 [Tricholoma furcatifolium]